MKNITSINATKNYKLLATGMVWGLSAGLAFAAASGSDSASNYAGVWGLSAPDNGTGLGNWGYTGGPSSSLYSTSLAGLATPILDAGGNTWAMFANPTLVGWLDIGRNFLPGPSGSAALFNQTFSFDLAVSGIPSPGPTATGFFYAVVGGIQLGFQEDGFNAPYSYFENYTTQTTVDAPISLGQWESGLAVSYSLSGPLDSTTENYTIAVSPVGGGTTIYSNSGTFDSTRFAPVGVNFMDYGLAGTAYFNSLNVTAEPVPEPTTFGLLGIGLAALLWRRR